MLATSNELLRGWRWRSQGFDDKGKLTKHTPSLLRVGGDDSSRSRSMCTAEAQWALVTHLHLCGLCEGLPTYGLYVSAGRHMLRALLRVLCEVARLRGLRSAVHAYSSMLSVLGAKLSVVLAIATSKQQRSSLATTLCCHSLVDCSP